MVVPELSPVVVPEVSPVVDPELSPVSVPEVSPVESTPPVSPVSVPPISPVLEDEDDESLLELELVSVSVVEEETSLSEGDSKQPESRAAAVRVAASFPSKPNLFRRVFILNSFSNLFVEFFNGRPFAGGFRTGHPASPRIRGSRRVHAAVSLATQGWMQMP